MSFSTNLRSELHYNSIQIKELAGKVNVPYSTFLSYVGKNPVLPRVDLAVKIANELGLTVEELCIDEPKSQISCLGKSFKSKMQNSLYNEIGLLPLEIQKILLLLIKEIINSLEKK